MIKVPNIDGLTIKLREIFESGWLTQGDWNRRFEEQTSKMANTSCAISCTNATTGLDIVFRSLENKGTVVIPTNTHYATVVSALNAGHKVWLTDIDPNHMMMSLKTLEDSAPPIDTVAVCFVGIGGQITPDIFKIKDWCDAREIELIEDCAHSHLVSVLGTDEHRGKRAMAGSIGLAGVFSYYPTKVAFGAEGGCITTNSYLLDEMYRQMRWFGRRNEMSFEDVYDKQGVNGVMSNVQACICHHCQDYLVQNIRERRMVAFQYDGLLMPYEYDHKDKFRVVRVAGCNQNYYKYTIICQNHSLKTRLMMKFDEAGVKLQMPVFDIGMHEQPHLKDCDEWLNKDGNFENADFVLDNHVCLPIGTGMEQEEINKVKTILREWINNDIM